MKTFFFYGKIKNSSRQKYSKNITLASCKWEFYTCP